MGIFTRKKEEPIMGRCKQCSESVILPTKFCSANCEWKYNQHLFNNEDRESWFGEPY